MKPARASHDEDLPDGDRWCLLTNVICKVLPQNNKLCQQFKDLPNSVNQYSPNDHGHDVTKSCMGNDLFRMQCRDHGYQKRLFCTGMY